MEIITLVVLLAIGYALIHPIRTLGLLLRFCLGALLLAIFIAFWANGCQLPELPNPPTEHHRYTHSD